MLIHVVLFHQQLQKGSCIVNWHIVKYLLHIVHKNILFSAILLHLILWQSMHFMRAFVCFYYHSQWTAVSQVACIYNKPLKQWKNHLLLQLVSQSRTYSRVATNCKSAFYFLNIFTQAVVMQQSTRNAEPCFPFAIVL